MRRFNIFALVVFLTGLVWVFTWKSERAIAVKTRVMSVFSPFIRTGASVQEAVEGAVEQKKSPSELAAENTRLHRELSELSVYAEDYTRLKDENDELRRMLDFAKGHPLKVVPARILTRNSATWWNTATIDRGLQDGLAPDLPVRTAEGLVGKVVHVWSRESEVLFITDETCRVAVRIEGSPDQGILSGRRGISGRSPDLHITFLPRDATVPIGSRVYTSGKGGIYPSGIPVGEISRFTALDDGGEAIVRPAVDFEKLKYLFVIEGDTGVSESKTSEARPPR